MQRDSACPPGTKGTSIQPSGGDSQALQPAATAKAGQPPGTLASSCMENYTYPLVTSTLPEASVSALPSYTPTSYSPTSAPDMGETCFRARAGTGHTSNSVIETNPYPPVSFFSLLSRTKLPGLRSSGALGGWSSLPPTAAPPVPGAPGLPVGRLREQSRCQFCRQLLWEATGSPQTAET